MPELPEVEASRALIDQHCTGRHILDVTAADDTKVFDGASSDEVVAAVKGRKLLGAHRKGKQMWLTLEGDGNKPNLLMHFGMTGYVAIQDNADSAVHVLAYENAPHETSSWPPRFHKLLLHFGPRPGDASGATCDFAYCDARRFGRVKLCGGDPADSEAISKLGFDPLLDMPDLQAFKDLLAARAKGTTRLKPLLLDQGFCAGVGNWVADEVLWQARLHPEQVVSALGDEHIKALHQALREVVQTAVAADADSTKFPKDWMFHVRWGKKAGSLLGHKLDHITVGSRTSCYVPALQKLVGGSTLPKGAAAPKAAGSSKQKKGKKRSQDEADDDDASDTADEQKGVGGDGDKAAPVKVARGRKRQVAGKRA